MVILYLYDPINGYRYRNIGYAYYCVLLSNWEAHCDFIVSAWILPDSVDSENAR